MKADGVVAACTLDGGDGVRMLHVFAKAARALDPTALPPGPASRYRTPAELRALWQDAGLAGVETAPLDVEAECEDVDDLWGGLLTGIGPDGACCVSLGLDRQVALREELRRRLGSPADPFTLPARIRAVCGRVP